MKLNLTKPIVFFDLETTGIDIATDRIVEICLIRVEPNGNKQSMTLRINPERHIPEEASSVHGIYDTDVKDCPTFREKAEELKKIFDGCDLAGFNSNRFDIPLLAEEFIRSGVNIDLNTPRRVDVQNIYHKLCFKHLQGSLGICQSGMCIFQVLVAIELICGHQCPAFQLVVNVLYIHTAWSL